MHQMRLHGSSIEQRFQKSEKKIYNYWATVLKAGLNEKYTEVIYYFDRFEHKGRL
jgi:hypothetical protein